MAGLDAADAHVFESEGAQAGGVEEVLGVNDDRPFEQVLDAIEVESAELRPACSYDQGIGAFGGGVRRITVANRSVEASLGFGNRNGIVGTNVGTAGNQSFGEADRRRAGNGVSVGLERQSKDSDFLVFNRIQREGDLFDQAVGQLVIDVASCTQNFQGYAL